MSRCRCVYEGDGEVSMCLACERALERKAKMESKDAEIARWKERYKRKCAEVAGLRLLLDDIVADVDNQPVGYDWPNLDRARAALAADREKEVRGE